MKIAILTLTKNGQSLALKISKKLENDPTVIKMDIFHKNVRKTLNDIFSGYDCILGIMATGIMVRNVCSLIKSKTEDPAVLVMDEKGKHVISLLSGHLGGGNEFTLKIAQITGADPVITSATDVNGKMGVDSMARKYHLFTDDPGKIMPINLALVNDDVVELYLPSSLQFIYTDDLVRRSYTRSSSPSKLSLTKTKDLEELVSPDNEKFPLPNNVEVSHGRNKLVLRPKKLVVGLGSRKGVTAESVLGAVKQALNILDIPLERIDLLATAEPKKNENGMVETARELGLPLRIIPLIDLKDFNHSDISESSMVREVFGVAGVCEPAALIGAGRGSKLILRKTVFNKVTVAVAVSKNP
ncbi:MAG TPA: cobalt-precorrin 5A hydrolase [Methanobacterium sp.]